MSEAQSVAEMLTEKIVKDEMSIEQARAVFLRFYRRKPAEPYVPVTCDIPKLADVERELILMALTKLSPVDAARALGISKTSIYRKIQEYGAQLRK